MIDWTAVERAGVEAAMAAMGRGAEKISARAKELAPVRKVFEGQDDSYRIRLKTIREIKSDANIRRVLNLGPENPYVHPPTIVSKRAPQRLAERTIKTLDYDSLDRRGRYEFKTKRAVHRGELGGRLRDEIHATTPVLDGRIIRVQVVSPTPYAKYQEFGTRHNPAHPYLRPAGHENRDAIRADIARSVVAASEPLIRGRFEVVATFRVRGAAA